MNDKEAIVNSMPPESSQGEASASNDASRDGTVVMENEKRHKVACDERKSKWNVGTISSFLQFAI